MAAKRGILLDRGHDKPHFTQAMLDAFCRKMAKRLPPEEVERLAAARAERKKASKDQQNTVHV